MWSSVFHAIATVDFLHTSFVILFPEAIVTAISFYQVKVKVSRSLKLMRAAAIRTRKLARDMLLYWKRVDKEMVFFLFSLYEFN